jgi:hypothetical protein
MDSAVSFPNGMKTCNGGKTCQDGVPALSLASAAATVAAGSLLGLSLLPGKRRLSNTSRLGLTVLIACAGLVMWVTREEEAAAVRNLLGFIGEKRDERWLRRNPIDFG